MKSKHNLLISLLILSFLFSITSELYPQDDYKKWLKKENEKFNKFVEEDDKKFVEFLKKEWIQIGLEKDVPVYQKPKPISLPVYKPDLNEQLEKPDLKSDDTPNEIKTEPTIIEQPPPNVITPPVTKEVENISTEPTMNLASSLEIDLVTNNMNSNINFFGSSIEYYYNDRLKVGIDGVLNKNKIAEYWNSISSTDYKTCLLQAQFYKEKMKLNDWGYAKLLFDYAKVVHRSSLVENYMFTWFMLIKSGYLVRVGYMNDKIALLIATDNKMYGLPYFFQKGCEQKFYSVSLDPEIKPLSGSLHIYKEDYPGSDKIFSLKISDVPQIKNSILSKEIKFSIKGVDFILPVKYDKSAIDFYEYYPQTDFSVYFAAPMSKEASENLLGGLKPLIEGKNELDAVNFLLHFVQYATEYKTDDEQFKREKPFFPEESLYYDYSDCEDRAVFFSYLIKNLLGLEVIGIDYPDHMATAVHFNENVRGTYFEQNNKKYIVCDPTYLGAGVGRVMPQYKGVGADIIELN